MDLQSFLVGVSVGAYLGWGYRRIWSVVRYNLGRRDGEPAQKSERPRMVLRSAFELARPASADVVNYAAWNAHLVAFARECVMGQRISERAVVSAGIVAGLRDYRVMARYMVRAGLWVSQGPARPKRWSDRHPARAVGRVAEALYSGRLVLPYPIGDPPPVYDRH